jgi:hypothetical protein
MIIPFATQDYVSQSLPVSSQQMENCYAEKEPQDAKSPVAIFQAPGITSFATLGSGPIRAIQVMGGVPYVLSGGTLYSVSSSGVGTVQGGQISGSGFVPSSNNGTQVMFVNGVHGYVWAQNTGFQTVTDPNFHAANSITFFDNVFVLNNISNNQWYISNSLDGTTYNGLAFAAAEVSPGFVLGIVNQQENLLLFCTNHTETWYDAGTPIFPFQRIDGATVERGCAAGLTAIKEDNSVFFLGDDLVFYRLDNFIPRRVSTHAQEDSWRSYSVVSDAYAFSFTYEGHKFVVLTFPSANATWIFDISTNLWHVRKSRDQFGNSYGRWRVSCVANCYNKILVGDAYSGQVGFLDKTVFTEYGNTMVSKMVAPSINQDRKRVYHSNFELDMETGVGNTVDPGSNPQVMLDWSDDGGRTYVNPQTWRTLGKIGAYKTRVRWPGILGTSRDRRYRVQISDPVPRIVIAARADITVGL